MANSTRFRISDFRRLIAVARVSRSNFAASLFFSPFSSILAWRVMFSELSEREGIDVVACGQDPAGQAAELIFSAPHGYS